MGSSPRYQISFFRGNIPCLLSLWLLTCLGGLLFLIDYSHQAGPTHQFPREWPTPVGLELATDKPTLLVFMHPHCPCSSATLSELERLQADVRGDMETILLFGRPAQAEDDWVNASLWQRTQQNPYFRTLIDVGGHWAAHFNVITSGHCLLYTPDGLLAFSGGITASRGHEGDNYGKTALTQIIRGDTSAHPQTPVFGCELIRLADPSTCTTCCENAP